MSWTSLMIEVAESYHQVSWEDSEHYHSIVLNMYSIWWLEVDKLTLIVTDAMAEIIRGKREKVLPCFLVDRKAFAILITREYWRYKRVMRSLKLQRAVENKCHHKMVLFIAILKVQSILHYMQLTFVPCFMPPRSQAKSFPSFNFLSKAFSFPQSSCTNFLTSSVRISPKETRIYDYYCPSSPQNRNSVWPCHLFL